MKPIQLTQKEADEISSSLALIPKMSTALLEAAETIDYLMLKLTPSGDRVITGFAIP